MNRTIAAAVLLTLAGAATAQAKVNINLNVEVPVAATPAPVPVTPPAYLPEAPPSAVPPQLVIEAPPRFIYAPELGFYVSVDIPYDIAFINRGYYLYSGGAWYLSRNYWGPWSFVTQRRLPPVLRTHRYEQIRFIRDREYKAFLHDREHYRGAWHQPSGGRGPEHREETRDRR